MIRPDEDTLKSFAHIYQNVPRVVEFFEKQYRSELERLPVATSNLAVAQGRCQVLGEICKLLADAPNAEPRRG